MGSGSCKECALKARGAANLVCLGADFFFGGGGGDRMSSCLVTNWPLNSIGELAKSRPSDLIGSDQKL
jgi:hypothetical protein